MDEEAAETMAKLLEDPERPEDHTAVSNGE